MRTEIKARPAGRSYVVSLDNRKRRGSGHERRAEILEAARKLFIERGVENVTTRQIAAEVGVSQTALFLYFASREQMLDALAEEAWAGMREALDAAARREDAPPDPALRLRATLAAFMRYWLGHADDFRIVFMRRAMQPRPDEPTGGESSGRKLLARLVERVEAGVKAGSLREFGCCNTTALSVWSAAAGIVSLRLAYPDFPWPPEEEHIEATLDMIFNGCKGVGAVLAPAAV